MSGFRTDQAHASQGLETDDPAGPPFCVTCYEDQARTTPALTGSASDHRRATAKGSMSSHRQGEWKNTTSARSHAFPARRRHQRGQHAKAGEITRSLLRAIYESVHGHRPHDKLPNPQFRVGPVLDDHQRCDVPGLNLGIERGGSEPDGNYYGRTKKVISKVVRTGDAGYRKIDQPPVAR